MLALKTEEGATRQGVQVALQTGKGKEMGSPLDIPEKDVAMLKLQLQFTENHFRPTELYYKKCYCKPLSL